MTDQTTQEKADLADKLVELLFPAPVWQERDGWWLYSGVDEIDGAIIDIKRDGGRVDDVSLRTIERVAGKLAEARRLVECIFGDRTP